MAKNEPQPGAAEAAALLGNDQPAYPNLDTQPLASEVAAYPDGRADIHEHPLEPFMARFTISKAF